MKIFGLCLIIEMLFSFIFVSIGILEKNNTLFSVIIICLNSLAFLLALILEFEKSGKSNNSIFIFIIFTSYILLMMLALFDVYISDINGYIDKSAYRRGAEYFFYSGEPLYKGKYSYSVLMLGSIFKIYGVQRILLQHLGILATRLMVFVVYKILRKLSVNEKAIKLAVLWAAFSPSGFLNSIFTTREPEIRLIVAISLYYFIMWYKESKLRGFIIANLLLILGSLLHAGIISISIGYCAIYLFYNVKNKKYKIRMRSAMLVIVLIFSALIFYQNYGDILFSKIGEIESVEDVTGRAGRSLGGSGYHTGGEDIKSIYGMLLYTPIQMIYFICAPVPWICRSPFDAISFMLGGLLYFIPIIMAVENILRYRKIRTRKKNDLIMALVVATCAVFIFSWGSSNVGTAIRHREKFISIFAVLLAVGANSKEKELDNKR